MKIDTDAFAKAFQMNMTEDDLKELMTSMTMSATASYDNNLQKLGYVDLRTRVRFPYIRRILRARKSGENPGFL